MENNKLKRNCPNCKCELEYTNLKNRNQAEKHNSICKKCSSKRFKESNRILMTEKYLKFDKEKNQQIIDIFEKFGSKWEFFIKNVTPTFRLFLKEIKPTEFYRNCPECKKQIVYKTTSSKNLAERNNGLCKPCCKKGEKNSFYGKTHKKESMKKMTTTKLTSDSWKKFQERQQTDEFKQNIKEKMSGDKNPAYNRGTLKDIWTKKFGEEIAEQKDKAWKEKQRINATGENNNMFGKPSPQGSGNGWSGWYKKWYFRSLGELSYMINVIEKENLNWESAENSKWKIPYLDYNNEKRNYFADFIIDGKKMIEIKPTKLINGSPSVDIKAIAAIKFCKERNMEYIIMNSEKISIQEIKKLYLNGEVKFLEKYEKKLIDNYLNKI